MFTGIITDVARSQPSSRPCRPAAPPAHRLPLRSRHHRRRRLDRLHGVCLTVVASGWRGPHRFEVRCRGRDAPPDHGERLGRARGSTRARAQDRRRAGGHVVAGHVDGIATIVARDDLPDMAKFELRAPRERRASSPPRDRSRSTRVADRQQRVEDVFSVLIIPHTCR